MRRVRVPDTIWAEWESAMEHANAKALETCKRARVGRWFYPLGDPSPDPENSPWWAVWYGEITHDRAPRPTA